MERKPKLLIAEDDELTRKLYRNIFSKEFDAVICKTGEEFSTELSQKQYEIFLIDLSLGQGKDGIDLIKELRLNENYKTSPIIVVTSYAFNRDESAAMNAGATRFIRKPVDNQVLVNTFKFYCNM